MTPAEYRQEYLKRFGEKIKQYRKEKGLSQDDLAQSLGYKSRSSINKIEHGIYDLPLQKMMDMAKVLGVDVAVLFADEQFIIENKEEDEALELARKIQRLDAYRRALVESIINTEPNQ